MTRLLSAVDLTVRTSSGRQILASTSIDVDRGETLALIGPSGSGKSTLCAALLGLLPAGATATAARVDFDGTPLWTAAGRLRRGVLGKRIGAVFQDPRASLTPHLTVRAHFVDAARAVGVLDRPEAEARGAALLEEFLVDRPGERLAAYPRALSGGLCQRVSLALALLHDPDLLVADEPTTALDPTSQIALLRVLRQAALRRGAALLLVTHDLGAAAGLADRVAVLAEGSVVETASVDDLFSAPRSAAARAMLAAARAAEGTAR